VIRLCLRDMFCSNEVRMHALYLVSKTAHKDIVSLHT
jgi:hypothetical protein